jgi:hypothetical protein
MSPRTFGARDVTFGVVANPAYASRGAIWLSAKKPGRDPSAELRDVLAGFRHHGELSGGARIEHTV